MTAGKDVDYAEVITGKGDALQLHEVQVKLNAMKGRKLVVAKYSDLPESNRRGGGLAVTLLLPRAQTKTKCAQSMTQAKQTTRR